MFYHCIDNNVTMRKVVKFSLITVYSIQTTFDETRSQHEPLPFDIVQFPGFLEIPYEILDMQLFNIRFNETSPGVFDMHCLVSMVVDIIGSYSNAIMTFDVIINPGGLSLMSQIDM